MEDKMKKYEGIQTVKPFVFPSEEIVRATEDLMIYFQLSNQKMVSLYKKWEKPKVIDGVTHYFKGNFWDYLELENFRDMMDLSFGKPWHTLIQAIQLTENADNKVNMEGFYKLNQDQQREVIEIITKGQTARETIAEWLKPINKKNAFEAIYDAMKVTIGNDKYDLFKILKVDTVNSKSEEDGSVKIFPEILEIDNSAALVEYLRTMEGLKDCLILTFMRNKKYDFKTTIYMFLVWKGTLYAIEMSDGRLNLENTAGARNPARYLERFEQVWLPFDKIMGRKSNKEENTITLRTQKVFKRGNIWDIFIKQPAISMWLEIFLYRVMDFIMNNKVQEAMTVSQGLLMLEDKLGKVEERVKIEEGGDSFESQNDASSYLLKKFGDKMTSLVPTKIELPNIMGTKNHIEAVIKYKQRVELAKNLEKELWKDYKKNSKNVYKKLREFVLSKDIMEVAEKALLDCAYPRMFYPEFGSTGLQINGKDVVVKEPTIYEEKILEVINYSEDKKRYNKEKREAGRHGFVSRLKFYSTFKSFHPEQDDLEIILTKNREFNKKIDRGQWRSPKYVLCDCPVCGKYLWNMLISLKFEDYRQFCAFFNVKPEELPIELSQHLHHQNETYVGNSILDDTDPLDEIKDPWFRKVYERQVEPYDEFPKGEPYLNIRIPLCNKCFKKANKEKSENTSKEEKEKRNI